MSTPEQHGHMESFRSTTITDYICPVELKRYEEQAGHTEKAFYYNNVSTHSAIGYMTPNEFYNKWMREHGKGVEPSILYPQK